MTLAMWVGVALAYGWCGGIIMGLVIAAIRDEKIKWKGPLAYRIITWIVVAFSTLFWPLEIGWILFTETWAEVKNQQKAERQLSPLPKTTPKSTERPVEASKVVH